MVLKVNIDPNGSSWQYFEADEIVVSCIERTADLIVGDYAIGDYIPLKGEYTYYAVLDGAKKVYFVNQAYLLENGKTIESYPPIRMPK